MLNPYSHRGMSRSVDKVISQSSERLVTTLAAQGLSGGGGGGSGLGVLSVEARQNTPPVSPTSGQVWLVGCSPTGAWVGHSEQLAEWTGAVWSYSSLTQGQIIYSSDAEEFYFYNGTSSQDYIDLWLLQNSAFQGVVEAYTSTPPGSPTDGMRYVVGASATGVWAGHDYDIARYRCGNWEFFPASEGWLVWVDASDQHLIYNDTLGAWEEYQSKIGLSLDVGAASAGQVPRFDGTLFTNDFLSFNDIENVNVGSPGALQDGYYIGWDNAAGEFQLKALPGGSGVSDLTDLSDVTITTPTSPQVIKYNGSVWVNDELSLNDLSDVDASSPSLNSVPMYTGSGFTLEKVPKAAESLRVVRGRVVGAATPTIDSGTGTFTVVAVGPGDYRVTITPAFSGNCTAVATVSSALGASNDRIIRVADAGTSTFRVLILTTAGSPVHESFSFICAGSA